MKVWGSSSILSKKEISLIESRMFDIFSKIGFRVENSKIVGKLKIAGAVVKNDNLIFFSGKWLKKFFSETERIDTDYSSRLEFWAGGYPAYFLPTGEKTPMVHTIKTCEIMVKIADYLKNIDIINSGMGIPSDVVVKTMELYQRLIVWKYFNRHGSFTAQYKPFHYGVSLISGTKILPYIFEMSEIMADKNRRKIQDYCSADLYLTSPLVFDNLQSEIFWELYEKGCHSDIGTVLTLGGTAPVTFSAALPLALAEIIFANILQRIFFNINTLHFTSILAPIDMKTGLFQYGRPELSIGILVLGQIARKYGALFNCGSYYCDAKLPSCEAGMQKTISAVSAILAGSTSIGVAGLLSIDELSSPEQLIIDAEFAGALKKFAASVEVGFEPEDYEVLQNIRPGVNFLGEMHTAKNCRNLWNPKFFSSESLNSWQKKKNKIDLDYAREIYDKILKSDCKPYVSDETEKDLLRVINKAKKTL
jgi:trimethylamine---corrinoid protein Co-methyltransferase